MRLSRNKMRAIAVKRAKADARWNIAIAASRDGLTKLEAANRAQMSPNGLNTMLYRKVKSTAWPIKEPEQSA